MWSSVHKDVDAIENALKIRARTIIWNGIATHCGTIDGGEEAIHATVRLTLLRLLSKFTYSVMPAPKSCHVD
eukprot:scaffold3768_cov253-Chaetoceros_neogracile.AAC.11